MEAMGMSMKMNSTFAIPVSKTETGDVELAVQMSIGSNCVN